jgi:hypothetical protein
MYAVVVDGIITGTTHWPNDQSKTPIDEKSMEWLDFLSRSKTRQIEDLETSLIDIETQLAALKE